MDEELEVFSFDADTDIEDAISALDDATPDEDDDDLSDEDLTDEDEAADEEDAEDEDDTTEEDEEGEDDPEDDDDEVDEDDDEEEGDDDPEDGDEPSLADDEAEVVVSVDGKDHRVSVKDLKRLYGQETALTQRSQALSEQRRAIEAQGLFYANQLQTRYEAAKTKAAQYKDVDLFRASRELEPEEFDALRAAKDAADSEVVALEREGKEFLEKATATKNTLLKEQAKEAMKEITKAIPEWSDDLYGRLRTYAVSQGMDKDTVNEVVDPGAIIMMHKAMQFDEAKAKAPKVKRKTTKGAKKVVRKSTKTTNNKASKVKAKRQDAIMSGDIDDIAGLMDALADQ